MIKLIVSSCLILTLFSCSTKVYIHCDSGFDRIKTNISISYGKNFRKEKSLIKDSILKSNQVVGLSYYSEFKIKLSKQIKINVELGKSKISIPCDSVFYFDLKKGKNKLYLDLKYNRKDSTFNFLFREFHKGEMFY